MSLLKVPSGFNGQLFAEKYKDISDLVFYVDANGLFQCPALPNLTATDLADCVEVSEVLTATIEERLEAAELMIDLLLTDTQGGA